MKVLLFITDDGKSVEGTGPALLVRDAADAVLPPHPRGFDWRYFASMDLDDAMLTEQRTRAASALNRIGWYTTPMLIFGRHQIRA